MAPKKKPIEQRLSENSKETPGGCIVWTGITNQQGYGRIRINGKLRSAHRIAYRTYIGEIPAGMKICHKCDNPSCINPDHLFLGTQADNNRDMFAKGRNVTTEGKKRLTKTQIRDIRVMSRLGRKNAEIGELFDRNPITISAIVNRRTY